MSEVGAIHQLVHTLSYGDAISTEVLALQRTLRALGYRSEIFAIGEHDHLRGRSRRHWELLNEERADIILHYSLGSPLNEIFSSWKRGRRTLVYHNITPVSWFEGVNSRVARDVQAGLKDLPRLCSLADSIWADSAFNASEIAALGFHADVLELLVDPARWSLPRNESVFQGVKKLAKLNILHVGRLAPNKCVEDILKAFRFIHFGLEKDSRLWLVGIDTDTELYSFSLREMATRLGIRDVVECTGCLTDEGVRAMYEAADAYVCMSEHEGFCLPLIEAMHFGLPVVAYSAGAVTETLGDGGVLVHEKRHVELGQLIFHLSQPGELRDRVVEAGHRRVSHFSEERFRARVADLVSRQRAERKAQGA